MPTKRKNFMRIDPTRTGPLRVRFRSEMRKRFKALIRAVRQMVIADDCFGLEERRPFNPLTLHAERQAFQFQTTPQKMKSFQRWFKQQVKTQVLSTDHSGKPWTDTYVHSAYRQGVVRAYIDSHPETLAPSKDFYVGGQSQFLRDAFAAPETVSKLELVSTRAFDQLEGITEQMSQSISRVLADGLANGEGAMPLAKRMSDEVAGIERRRAETLVRTEVIHAHAEGQLDSYERLGEEEVGLQAEWSTADDEKVCPRCQPLDGVVMTIKEARGLIPRHPNCRCTWVPALDDEKEKGQKRGRRAESAIESSLEEDGGEEKSTWAGKEI